MLRKVARGAATIMERFDIIWRGLDPIKAKVALDHVPEQPELYKLTFEIFGETYVYIGQAENCRRRIGEYAHNPTEGNYMEHFLFDLLNEADGAKLSICCDDGLQTEQVRLEREKVAIAETRRRGLTCLNKGIIDNLSMQRFRLQIQGKSTSERVAASSRKVEEARLDQRQPK